MSYSPPLAYWLAKKRRRRAGSGATVAALPLDAIGTAPTGAWHMRKLRTAYAGQRLRDRRSSDSTEADNGFDDPALLTRAGAGSAFAAKFYDQSGAARELVQATAALQPKLVSSGALVTNINNKLCADFDTDMLDGVAISNFVSASAYTIFSVSRPEAGAGSTFGASLIVGDNAGYLWHGVNASNQVTMGHFGSGAELAFPITLGQPVVAVSRFDGSTFRGWVGGGSGGSIANTAISAMTGTLKLGRSVNGNYFDGQVGGLATFNAALSLADLNTLAAWLAADAGATWTTAT